MTHTSYGLEPLRIASLRRRRLIAIAIALGAAGVWTYFLLGSVSDETNVSIFGRDGSRVEIRLPSGEKPAGEKPVTVGVSPGRVVRSPEPLTPQTAPQERANPQFLPPVFFRINWLFILVNIVLPFAIIALAARRFWVAGKRPHLEVNFGVYKGAMPYEMLTAREEVFSRSEVLRPLYQRIVPATRVSVLRSVGAARASTFERVDRNPPR